MALDMPNERRAAFNFLLTPWVILPAPDDNISSEDRFMMLGCYQPDTVAMTTAKDISKIQLGIGLGINI